jgi:hypothetical protein
MAFNYIDYRAVPFEKSMQGSIFSPDKDISAVGARCNEFIIWAKEVD